MLNLAARASGEGRAFQRGWRMDVMRLTESPEGSGKLSEGEMGERVDASERPCLVV